MYLLTQLKKKQIVKSNIDKTELSLNFPILILSNLSSTTTTSFLWKGLKELLVRHRQDLALGVLDLLEADEPVLEPLFERQATVKTDSESAKS